MCPPCFFYRVVTHPCPPNFKIMNCEKYDGTTNPVIWIGDYILAVQVVNGNNFHTVKHLPLMLKGSAQHWSHTLKPGSIDSWADLQAEFMANF